VLGLAVVLVVEALLLAAAGLARVLAPVAAGVEVLAAVARALVEVVGQAFAERSK
jgi:hypothetical protein